LEARERVPLVAARIGRRGAAGGWSWIEVHAVQSSCEVIFSFWLRLKFLVDGVRHSCHHRLHNKPVVIDSNVLGGSTFEDDIPGLGGRDELGTLSSLGPKKFDFWAALGHRGAEDAFRGRVRRLPGWGRWGRKWCLGREWCWSAGSLGL
jgi:hypothetical protein